MENTLIKPNHFEESEHAKEVQEKITLLVDAIIELQEKIAALEASGDNKDELVKLKVQKGYKLRELETLKEENGLSENRTEKSEKNILGIESPDLINHTQALAWVKEKSQENHIMYELIGVKKLKEAYDNGLEDFQKTIYLSGTPDDINVGNVFGVDFNTGEIVSRGKGKFFAVQPVQPL